MGPISLLVAVGAGLAAFFSPCVLPMIPLYLSYFAGTLISEIGGEQQTRHVFVNSLLFCLGLSVMFTLMGATASWLGQQLRHWFSAIYIIAAGAIFLYGLGLVGLIPRFRFQKSRQFSFRWNRFSWLTAFLFGVLFALGWTPCVGPILAAILAVASTQDTVLQGMMLLAAFSFGLSIPFIVLSLAIKQALKWITLFKSWIPLMEKISGWLMISVAVVILWMYFMGAAVPI